MSLSARRLHGITSIVGVTLASMLLFGLLLPLLDPSRHVLLSAIEGFFIGLPIGILERGVFERLSRRLSFTTTLIIRTVTYAAIWLTSGLAVVGLVLWASPWSFRQIRADGAAWRAFFEYYNGLHANVHILAGLTLSLVISFAWQINGLLGRGVLMKYISGRYHRPRIEHRIFMFLDLDSATSLAERLGAERYSSLLRDFFYDLSDMVVETRGEIVQYVGDEVVVSWTVANGIRDHNCIRVFYLAVGRIADLASVYEERYGVVPTFKAGVHAGTVVVTEVGKIRREIVYHGDAMNTAARIAAACHDQGQRLLISGAAVELLADPDRRYGMQDLGSIAVKGRAEQVALFTATPLD